MTHARRAPAGRAAAPPPPERFPVVAVGASAGGLAAFTSFFSGLPPDVRPGVAFVLVQHLAPDRDSLLAELVGRLPRENALLFHAPGVPPRVTLRAIRDGAHVSVTVTDAGIGVDPADAERIFGPFVRLNPEEAYPGNGIGLALARRAARMMGAEVRLVPATGAGATFELRLPSADPDDPD